jgi:polyferredoxin
MFVFVAALAVVKYLKETGVVIPLPEISLHAVCPFGGVVTVYEFLSSGSLVPKLHTAALVLMSLGLVVAFFFGPIFCGYFCPLGTMQEWIGKLGKKIFKKKYGKLIPPAADKVMRYLRYVVLAVVVYQTAAAAKLVFVEVDPYYALFNFFTGEVAWTAIAVLLGTMVLSLFVERPWCKYLCPYGALLGLFNLIRVFPVRRREETCINCKKCDAACPMQIKVSTGKAVRDHQCISCHECLSGAACPVKDTVIVSAGKGGAEA